MSLRFYMPIVAPPAQNQTYSDIVQDLEFNVVKDPATGSSGLQVMHSVSDSGASPLPLLAVAKSMAKFIPEGEQVAVLADLSLEAPAPGGALFLQLLPAETIHLASQLTPVGVAPYAYVFYSHVNAQSVESNLKNILAHHVDSHRITQQALRQVLLEIGVELPPGADLPHLQELYLTRFMLGQVHILVDAGKEIGQAELVSSSEPHTKRRFVLQYYGLRSRDADLVHPLMEISPLLPLRNLPIYSDASGAPTDVWDGHPLIAQLRNQTAPFEAHLQFVVCDVRSQPPQHVPLPAGINVALMVTGTLWDKEIARETTDGSGVVRFQIADLGAAAANEYPDIYFEVRTQGIIHAGHSMPDKWSTQGWLATDDKTPGWYKKFAGTGIGFTHQPVILHIGVELHVGFQYRVDPSSAERRQENPVPLNSIKKNPFPFPEGVFMEVTTSMSNELNPFGAVKQQLDQSGEIHTVLFDVSNNDIIAYRMLGFAIEDASINLHRAEAVDPLEISSTLASPLRWFSRQAFPGQTMHPLQGKTHVGTVADVENVELKDQRFQDNRFRAAIYLFKNLREWSVALHHLTGGAWPGITNLTIGIRAPAAAFSWPIGRINIPGDEGVGNLYGYSSYWDRSTHIHELSHQIVWQQTSLNGVQVGLRYLSQSDSAYSMHHTSDLKANPGHAFVEGWPAFMEALFSTTHSPPFSPSRFDTGLKPKGTLGPAFGNPVTFNTGFSVEGAFANAIYLILKRALIGVNHVPTEAPHHGTLIPESVDGNVASGTTWITDRIARQRFMDFIYTPLSRFPDNKPTTEQYLRNIGAAIRADGTLDWDEMLADIRTQNVLMGSPQLLRITPDTGPITGQTVAINGDFFINNLLGIGSNSGENTKVLFDGNPVPSPRIGPPAGVKVINTKKLEVTTPTASSSAHGRTVDVTVKTLAGTVTLPNAYTYAGSPALASVSPTTAPRAGGTTLTLQGTHFLSGRTSLHEVFIGGYPAPVLSVVGEQITLTAPSASLSDVGRAVDVRIVTPGGTDMLVAAFTFT